MDLSLRGPCFKLQLWFHEVTSSVASKALPSCWHTVAPLAQEANRPFLIVSQATQIPRFHNPILGVNFNEFA